MNKLYGTAGAAALLLAAAACSDDNTQTQAQPDAYEGAEVETMPDTYAQNGEADADVDGNYDLPDDPEAGMYEETRPDDDMIRQAEMSNDSDLTAFDEEEGWDTAAIESGDVTVSVTNVAPDAGPVMLMLEPQTQVQEMQNQPMADTGNMATSDEMAAEDVAEQTADGQSMDVAEADTTQNSDQQRVETYTAEAEPIGNAVQLIVEDVQPGTYLISVFQDEDGNGEVTRDGETPSEPWGTTASSAGDFEPAMITVTESGAITTVRLERGAS